MLDTTIECKQSAYAQSKMKITALSVRCSLYWAISLVFAVNKGVEFHWFDFGRCLRQWWSLCICIFSVHISSTSVTWIASSMAVPRTARLNLTLSSFFFANIFFQTNTTTAGNEKRRASLCNCFSFEQQQLRRHVIIFIVDVSLFFIYMM